MSTERKLVEFHKAKTILMKPLAYSLINSFFSKRRRLFTEVLFRARWFFTSAHKRPGEWEHSFFFAVCDCTLAYLKHLINKPLWTDFRNHVLLNAARVFGAQAFTSHVRFGNSGTPFFVFVLFFVFITAVTVFCYESMFEQRFSVPPRPQEHERVSKTAHTRLTE